MIRSMILALVLLVTGVAIAADPSAATSQDAQVRQGAKLLVTTFYRKLEPRRIVEAERDALGAYLRSHAAPHVVLPPVSAALDAAGMPDAAAAQLDAAVRSGRVGASEAAYIALKAMTQATKDRYTAFFTPNEYKSFDQILDPAKLSGIGVLLDVDPATTYVRAFFVVPDTPADKAGMKSGDLIESIDGVSTHGFSIAQARKHLLGATGSNVDLAIERPSDSTKAKFTLTRAEVQPPTVYFSMLPDHIAYLYVAAFGNATPGEFHTAVARMESSGARAYVLDLRNDGGGIVGTALAVSSSFVHSGPLVSIESNAGEIETFEADDSAIAPKPLAVLVNAYTASASEITAAAISESRTGILVGTKTFGKGVVQSVSRFPDGSAIKITTGRYFTPLNHDINGRGIVPTVMATENPRAVFGTPSKDAQLSKALDLLEVRLAQAGGSSKPE